MHLKISRNFPASKVPHFQVHIVISEHWEKGSWIIHIDDFCVPGDEGYAYPSYGPTKTLNFDYIKNCVFFLPRPLPSPSDKTFAKVISHKIIETAVYYHGKTFVLFTSYGLLSIVKNNIQIGRAHV